MAGDSEDKQWAKKYLLDPFTEPEPSQETGPGTSFYNPQRSLSMRAKPVSSGHSRNSSYPTPPHSANSTHDSFHPSNPFSGSSRASSSHERGDWAPAGTILGRSSSINSRNSGYNPRSPTHQSQRDTSDFGRSKTVRYPPQTHHTQASSSKEPGLYRSTSAASGGIQRRGSLNQRYPGDMSHKPLDMLKQDHRSVERKHRRQKSKNPPVDTIDALDKSFGGSYHHSGPYDATLAASNINKKYSPLEAVKDTNMEAIKATPQAYINDSLVKHVPLQGTATVPPGEMDIGGRFMEYEEGADLMREPSAGGGAYKRWDGVSYLPDDYKGKGEPSFTYERDLKEKQARSHRHTRSQGNGPIEYEMQPTGHRRSSGKNGEYTVRQRSVSAAAEGAGPSSRLEVPMSPNSPKGFSTNNDIRRHNSTGKRISDGLKRRFGSIRRKKDIEQEV